MKSVTIIGCADGWADAPSGGECWGITSIVLRRDVTRVFDIHDLSWSVQQWYDHYIAWAAATGMRNQRLKRAKQRVEQMPSMFERVNELGIPLYSTSTYAKVPTSVEYPMKQIQKRFRRMYFASTFDYAICLAISEGFDVIDLYGLRMSGGSEYEHQVKSAHYWLGYAEGMGIATTVHGETHLFKTKNNLIYGYNTKMER
jgi:hypothetical protein